MGLILANGSSHAQGNSQDVLRIANCSGFYGDRLSAPEEMVDGGPIDVLSGDWLAELTMLILFKIRTRTGRGYAQTFVSQLEQVLGKCLDRKIAVVSNAGGLDPNGCADAVGELAERLGLRPSIAVVAGDDLLGRLDEMRTSGETFANLDTGEAFGQRNALTANAYLGCWGIAEALSNGADVVITGRTSDASVVMGPAAAHFRWQRDDWDRLAGACVAGHAIECGCQVTGGNYSFFREAPDLEHPGFPIAEVYADGSSVITKHPGSGGIVSVGTVTAQLLYEIGGPRYFNPDVIARFDTVQLTQEGPDRVGITGVRGEPAPARAKVSINFEGGWKNSVVFCLTGLDIVEKASLVEHTLLGALNANAGVPSVWDSNLIRSDRADPARNEDAIADLIISVKDSDRHRVGRAFSNAAIEMALASYPGFFVRGGPSDATAFGVNWPTTVPAALCPSLLTMDGICTTVDAVPGVEPPPLPPTVPRKMHGPRRGSYSETPLGRLFGARSGDKGGNANLGVWARTLDSYEWLSDFLDANQLGVLLPETKDLTVERYAFPNLLGLNFVIRGLLDEGVASNFRLDPQAKGLGEYLRSKLVRMPQSLVERAE